MMDSSVCNAPENILHPENCKESPADFTRMQQCLQSDPSSLEKMCTVFTDEYYCKNKYSPLQSTIICEHYKCAKFLLENGARVQDSNTNNPLLEKAVVARDTSFVELILQQGGNPNYDPNETNNLKRFRNCRFLGTTYILHLAITKGDVTTVKLLLDHGADTEDFDAIIRIEPPFPALVAITEVQPECLKLLLLYGACIEPILYSKATNPGIRNQLMPLLRLINPYRSSKSDLELLYILYSFGVNLHLKDSNGLTALQDFEKQSINATPELHRLFPTEAELNSHMTRYRVLVAELRGLMSEPRSLQDLSRLTLRRVLGRRYLAALPHLKLGTVPLPPPISRFLHF